MIANQKQTEMRLSRAMDDLGKANASTRQALLMVDDAQRRGDTAKVTQYNQAAEGFANRLIAIEKQVEDLKTMDLQTTQAADQAKAAVAQNSAALQKKLAERQKLLSQLDQAKMQEQMNVAMATLSQTVGQDVPSFDQVRDRSNSLTQALVRGQSRARPWVSRMLEVDRPCNTEAESRLLRAAGSELG